MNVTTFRARARAGLIGLAALAMLGGCDRAPDRVQAPLAGAAIGGPFALVDQDGRPVTDRSYAGRWRIMYFGYTFCPDVCPDTLTKVMKGYHAFAAAHPEAAKKLVPIFVSVDPARDTPEVMKRYTAAFGPELVGLTGSADAIAATAKRFGVYYHVQKSEGASGYLVDHSSVPILFDPDGKPIEILPADQGADAIAADLAKWVA